MADPWKFIEQTKEQIGKDIRKGLGISDVNPDYVKPPTSLSKDHAVLTLLERKFDISFKAMDGGSKSESLLETCLSNYIKKIQKDCQTSIYSPGEGIKQQHDQLGLIKAAANQFLCAIDDEIAKGERSALRIGRGTTKFPYITIISLDVWAREMYQIEILKPPITVFQDFNCLQHDDKRDQTCTLENSTTTNQKITLALLVDAMACSASCFKHADNSPNVSRIADEIVRLAKDVNSEPSGQSKRSIEDYIKDAIRNPNGKLSKTKVKNLQILIANLVEVFAARGEDYQNPDKSPNVPDIAKYLISLAEEKSILIDENIIISCIEDAFEVRKNPDKRET